MLATTVGAPPPSDPATRTCPTSSQARRAPGAARRRRPGSGAPLRAAPALLPRPAGARRPPPTPGRAPGWLRWLREGASQGTMAPPRPRLQAPLLPSLRHCPRPGAGSRPSARPPRPSDEADRPHLAEGELDVAGRRRLGQPGPTQPGPQGGSQRYKASLLGRRGPQAHLQGQSGGVPTVHHGQDPHSRQGMLVQEAAHQPGGTRDRVPSPPRRCRRGRVTSSSANPASKATSAGPRYLKGSRAPRRGLRQAPPGPPAPGHDPHRTSGCGRRAPRRPQHLPRRGARAGAGERHRRRRRPGHGDPRRTGGPGPCLGRRVSQTARRQAPAPGRAPPVPRVGPSGANPVGSGVGCSGGRRSCADCPSAAGTVRRGRSVTPCVGPSGPRPEPGRGRGLGDAVGAPPRAPLGGPRPTRRGLGQGLGRAGRRVRQAVRSYRDRRARFGQPLLPPRPPQPGGARPSGRSRGGHVRHRRVPLAGGGGGGDGEGLLRVSRVSRVSRSKRDGEREARPDELGPGEDPAVRQAGRPLIEGEQVPPRPPAVPTSARRSRRGCRRAGRRRSSPPSCPRPAPARAGARASSQPGWITPLRVKGRPSAITRPTLASMILG